MTEVEALRIENARLQQRVKLLESKLDALARRLFGKKAEHLDERQLKLLLGAAEAALGSPAEDPDPDPSGPGPKGRRKFDRKERWPSDLPVEEKVIVPEEVERSPEDFREIGQEVSEQIDYDPPRFFLRRTVRPTFARKGCDDAPITAPLPERAVERGIAGPGLLAAIITAKYCDHLPLYRQQAIFESRHQVHLSRQNMANWVALAAFWMRPIYERIRSGVMAGGYVQIDETPIRYLDPGRGETATGYLWTVHEPGGETFYRWETSRSAQCIEILVPAGFRGAIQCDGYAAYGAFAKRREGIGMVSCLAHIRRKFYEAKEESPRLAGWMLQQMGHLYRVEARLREAQAAPVLREAARASQSAKVYERLGRALLKLHGRHLPASAMGKAVGYALANWEGLRPWLEDGRVEIDNNLVENAIRPTAVGKKNWLFMGSGEAGQTGAILFTIIACCRLHGINPFDYLRDVLDRIPSMTNRLIAELMPEAWANARRKAPLPAAARFHRCHSRSLGHLWQHDRGATVDAYVIAIRYGIYS